MVGMRKEVRIEEGEEMLSSGVIDEDPGFCWRVASYLLPKFPCGSRRLLVRETDLHHFRGGSSINNVSVKDHRYGARKSLQQTFQRAL